MPAFDWIVLGFAAIGLGVPLIIAWLRGWRRWLALAALIDAVALAWLALPITWGAWAGIYAVAASLTMFGVGISKVSTGFALVSAFAWLSFPLYTTVGGNWSEVHPLLVANAITGLPPWLEQPTAYGITRLGSEVPYELSRRWVRCAMVHTLAGVICLGVGLVAARPGAMMSAEEASDQ